MSLSAPEFLRSSPRAQPKGQYRHIFPRQNVLFFSAAAPSRLLDSADSFLSGFGGRVSA